MRFLALPSPSQGVWYLGPIPIRAYGLIIACAILPFTGLLGATKLGVVTVSSSMTLHFGLFLVALSGRASTTSLRLQMPTSVRMAIRSWPSQSGTEA